RASSPSAVQPCGLPKRLKLDTGSPACARYSARSSASLSRGELAQAARRATASMAGMGSHFMALISRQVGSHLRARLRSGIDASPPTFMHQTLVGSSKARYDAAPRNGQAEAKMAG